MPLYSPSGVITTDNTYLTGGGTPAPVSLAFNSTQGDNRWGLISGTANWSGTQDFSSATWVRLSAGSVGTNGQIGVNSSNGNLEWFVGGTLKAALAVATATATYAPLISPALSGTPTVPTAAGGTNTTQVANTAFVAAGFQPLDSDLTAIAALAGTGYAVQTAVGTWAQRTFGVGSAHLTVTNANGVAGNTSYDIDLTVNYTWTGTHSFTGGVANVTTQAQTDNSTKAASTAFVKAAEHYQLIATLTPSAVTQISTSAFTAGAYSTIKVVFSGVVPTTGADNLQVILRGGGANVLTVASTGGVGTNPFSGWVEFAVDSIGAAGSFYHTGVGYFNQLSVGRPTTPVVAFGAGNANQPTLVRIQFTGNITSGTILVYGLQTSA